MAGCNPVTIQIATPEFLDPKKRAVTDGDVACKQRSYCTLTVHKALPPSCETHFQFCCLSAGVCSLCNGAE